MRIITGISAKYARTVCSTARAVAEDCVPAAAISGDIASNKHATTGQKRLMITHPGPSTV
jgi:hypothetical protein